MPIRWTKTRLLGPDSLPASRDDFRVVGVFNPAAIRVGRQVVLVVRVAELPTVRRPGFTPLPRYDTDGRLLYDWLADQDFELTDARIGRVRATGQARLTSVSHLRIVWLDEHARVERLGPAIVPAGPLESFGLEDPRVVALESRYCMTYVAVSRHGVTSALASTTDFETFERHGTLLPPENKDVMLFPERIAGQYAMLHRPVGHMPFTSPEMWLARSPDLVNWGQHQPLYRGTAPWETGRVGGGAPPVRTDRGWLVLYHGNRRPQSEGEVGAYCGGGLLLDLDDPTRLLRVAAEPLLVPSEPFELTGFVPQVAFPSGVVHDDDRIAVYYGAADESTAVAEASWDDIWAALGLP